MKSSTRNLIIGAIGLTSVCIVLSALFLYFAVKPSHPPPQPEAAPPTPEALPSPASVSLVDQIFRELDWGNIAFNTPGKMRYARSQLIELLLSPSQTVADLQAQLRQKVGAESAHIHISNLMEAQLTGTGYAIQALQPALQAVTSQQITRWSWMVTPTQPGRQTLYLSLSAHIEVASRDAPLVVQTFQRAIQVDISIPQRLSAFAQKNWQWLWATLVVPIAGYLWNRRKRRRAKPQKR